MTTTTLRRLTSMTYGESLATGNRSDGRIAVMSSGGITGSHDKVNTFGPVIVVGRKGSYGTVWWSSQPVFVIDTAYSIDRSNTACDLRWLYYVLKSLRLDSISNDVGVPGLSREAAYETTVRVVEPSEQRRIANFLDDRVARIDWIIAARKQQAALAEIAHLDSLRQVTDGLGAADGWSRPRVAHIFRTGSGSTPPSDHPEYYDGDVPWVNTGDVRDASIAVTSRTVTESALAEFSTLVRYPRGSLVIAMYGQGATKGRVGLLELEACVNQACCVIQHGEPGLLQWAFHWFRAHKAEIVELANGAGQPNLSQDIVRNLRPTLPPSDALPSLLRGIEERDASLIMAQSAIRAQIVLLQEYKQSLITAAVTGELDVTTAGNGIPS